MYIRTKIVKGFTYYQVVAGHRDGAKVRQKIVAALGQSPTVEGALKVEKRRLSRLRSQRKRYPETIDPAVWSKTDTARLTRLDERIIESVEQIERLTGIIKTMKADTKKRSANHKAVED